MGTFENSLGGGGWPAALMSHLRAYGAVVFLTTLVFACALATAGCGSSSNSAARRASAVWDGATVLAERDPTDRDDDRPGAGRYDPDNDQTLTRGRVPNVVETAAITALIRRYYATLVRGELRAACSLLYPPLLESLSEEHGSSGDSHANACAQVVSSVLADHRRELVGNLVSQRLIEARITQRRGLVRVLFAGRRDRLIRLHGRGANWQMDSVFDGGSP